MVFNASASDIQTKTSEYGCTHTTTTEEWGKKFCDCAACALVEEILQTYPGKTFLCAYKKDTARLADSLSGKARAQLAWMPDPDRPGAQILPYFGGTNGSNLFRDCTNVILLGYPRLSPGVYLERCWAAWKEGGVGEAIRRVQLNMQDEAHPWRDGLRCLPMVADYEAHHLASRLEQEIYRCKLRDPAVRTTSTFSSSPRRVRCGNCCTGAFRGAGSM